jgi:hypothetical protein
VTALRRKNVRRRIFQQLVLAREKTPSILNMHSMIRLANTGVDVIV